MRYGEPPLKLILALAPFAPPVHSSIRMRAISLFSSHDCVHYSALGFFLFDNEQVGAVGLIELGNLQTLVRLVVSLVRSSYFEHIIDCVGENAQSNRTHQCDDAFKQCWIKLLGIGGDKMDTSNCPGLGISVPCCDDLRGTKVQVRGENELICFGFHANSSMHWVSPLFKAQVATRVLCRPV